LGILERIANTIYPPKCIFCRESLGNDIALHICSACYAKLPFSRETLMPVLENETGGHCDGAVSVFQYTGMAKDSLIRFKFYNKPSYYRTFARLLACRLKKIIDIKQYNMVMSVPLHRQKEFARGYNQAYLVSRALSRELHLPECSGLLKRQKYTNSQSLLSRQNRQENIKGAFLVKGQTRIKGKSILLVDDILTTGSTVEECSKMLKQAGVTKVTAAVVATGRKY
jgi:competence protein ComFC